MNDLDEPPETRQDALDHFDELYGRHVITEMYAEDLAEPFGLDLDDTDLVSTVEDELAHHDGEDDPAVSVAELVTELVDHLGGEPHMGNSLIGSGASADYQMDDDLPKLKELVEDDDDT